MIKKLFGVYLGGRVENKFIEDHDIVFVIAENKDEAKQLAKNKTKITSELHCDGIICIENVDGYYINLEKNNFQDSIEFDSTYSEIN